MFHCRPSELDSEDGLFLLKMLDIRHWRDAAAHYDNDPQTSMVSNEDKKRFMFLSMGVRDALYLPLEELSDDLLAKSQETWGMSAAKKQEINMMMAELNAAIKEGKDGD